MDPVSALLSLGELGFKIYQKLHAAKQAKDQEAFNAAWYEMNDNLRAAGGRWDAAAAFDPPSVED